MQSFRILLSYTDAEFDCHERLARRRYVRRVQLMISNGQIAVGVAVALVAALVCVAAQVATPHGAGLIAVLTCAAFWAGIWTPELLSRRRYRRQLRAYYAAWQARMAGSVLVVTTNLLVVRTPQLRAIYKRAAIQRTGTEGGLLLLLWVGGEPGIAIPLRLLTPEQRDWLLSFHAGATPAAG